MIVGTLVLAVAVVGAAVYGLWRSAPEPDPPGPGPVPTTLSAPPAPGPTKRPPTASLVGVGVSATCVAPDSVDSAGNRTTYPAGNAVDGDLTTAWRCRGDGTGEALTVSFPAPVTLSAVGLVPGLAKTDPQSRIDRYAQNRRISAVRLAFDGGQVIEASLDTSSTNRRMQWTSVGPVTTSTLTITILSSQPGTAQGEFPANETVAISEVGVK